MLTPSNVYSVCYDATEQQAISSHFDGAVRIWDIRTNRMDRENIVHASPVTSIVFMPNQNEILTNSRDNCSSNLSIFERWTSGRASLRPSIEWEQIGAIHVSHRMERISLPVEQTVEYSFGE